MNNNEEDEAAPKVSDRLKGMPFFMWDVYRSYYLGINA